MEASHDAHKNGKDRAKGRRLVTHIITRRTALMGLGTLAASGLSGCNTPQTAMPPAAAPALASGLRIGNIAVDTAPLVAQSGNPTAQWAQNALPGAIAQAFAAHIAPGDPSAATLSVRIDSIYLGGGGPADPDIMRGVATLNGRQVRVRATATYIASPTDQALPEQALQGRVNTLCQAFAYWLARRMRL